MLIIYIHLSKDRYCARKYRTKPQLYNLKGHLFFSVLLDLCIIFHFKTFKDNLWILLLCCKKYNTYSFEACKHILYSFWLYFFVVLRDFSNKKLLLLTDNKKASGLIIVSFNNCIFSVRKYLLPCWHSIIQITQFHLWLWHCLSLITDRSIYLQPTLTAYEKISVLKANMKSNNDH